MYLKWYDTNQITELQLTEDLILKEDMTIFEPVQAFVTNKLNHTSS